ncbi:MAG: hypothetical protein ACO20G_00595 [Ilumatobacteraceae bacterium]|nr:hypothetical protein [Actinomycetota bacterium]
MNIYGLVAAGGDIDPSESVHWLWPPAAELIYGGIASLIIFSLLWKFAGPAAKKGMADRTARIQADLDAADAAVTGARQEAEEIRRAAGDIDAERSRLLAEADAQAADILSDGRARIETEVAELEARAAADAASMGDRLGDELRAEIASLSAEVTQRLLAETLDDAAQQQMIEDFIQKVGSSS